MFEKFIIWIAWHLPRELVSHAYARVVAHFTYTHPDKVVPDITAMDALHDWVYQKEI